MNADLRVCIAVAPYPPQFGGHGIQIARSLPFLRACGIRPTVLTLRNHGSKPTLDDTVHRVLSPESARFDRVRRVLELRRYFRRHASGYDVLHTALHGHEFILNAPYLKSLGLPLVYESVLLGVDDPLTLLRERFGRAKMSLLRRVDAWTGISRAFLPRVTAAGISEQRFHLIYCGVDLGRFRPPGADVRAETRARLGFPVQSRIVLSAGSLIHRKGMDRVLEAWAAMRPVHGRDFLVLAGPAANDEGLSQADRDFGAQLQRAAERPETAGTVRFTGRVENLETYMQAADLFVFLSRREGLGNVIIEAMASGLPCVVSPLDGIASELIDEGRTGHIVTDPDDAVNLARLVARLLSDAASLTAMGLAGRAVAQRKFSFEARASAYRDLYVSLAHASPRQTASIGGQS